MAPKQKKDADPETQAAVVAAPGGDAAAAAGSSSSQPPKAGSEPPAKKTGWWTGDVQIDIASTKRGEKKWTTLEHNGVYFPPAYVRHNIPIRYEGKTFELTEEEEEIATMYATMKDSDYYRNPIFKKNFFMEWRKVLDKRPHPIKTLELCDFEAIYQWFCRERDTRNAMPSAEKKLLKEAREKEMQPFSKCKWDGREEDVAGYRVEPPGLFRGRGKHPLQGRLKKRLYPEDITLNLSKGAPIPPAPPGRHWKEIVHDNTVTWLAMWHDTVTGGFKYVMMAPSSTIKGLTDREKFEKARRLKGIIGAVRKGYTADFSSPELWVRQRAVATYFIDKLALRVGNEKGEDEADTVGCCSLRFEHVRPIDNHVLSFNFPGKDSVPYVQDVEVLPVVYDLVCSFRRGKKPGDDLFDKIEPQLLNEHFKTFMDGLSAKVFRTYNASICLQEQLAKDPPPHDATVEQKMIFFNKCNTQVAILCNHQKGISKNHGAAMATMKAKIDHQKALIAALEAAKVLEDEHGRAEAVRLFYEKDDTQQWEWLNAHGTEEEKETFRKEVEERNAALAVAPAARIPKKKSTSSSSAVIKKSKSSSKKVAKKTAKKSPAAAKSATKKKAPAAKKQETPAKKGKKAKSEEEAPQAEEEDEEEEDGEDDDGEENESAEENDSDDDGASSSSSDEDGSSSSSSSGSSSSSIDGDDEDGSDKESSADDEDEDATLEEIVAKKVPPKKVNGKAVAAAPPAAKGGKKAVAAKKAPSPPPSPKKSPAKPAKGKKAPSPPPSPKKSPAKSPKGKKAPSPPSPAKGKKAAPPAPAPAAKTGGRGKASRDEDEDVPPKKPAAKRR